MPEPLTRVEKVLFLILWIVVIATRLPAMAKSLFDWDETLFAFGLEDYDVSAHHPHPPGYPLFILAAKMVRPLVGTDFSALQLVATIGSALLFPAVFLLARELKLPNAGALVAALVTSFLPTVWYYGGAALSDVPAVALALFAAALLLSGARSPRAYLAGSVIAALAAGFRPQLLLIMAVSALIGAFALRRWRAVALAWLIGAMIVVVSYGGAAYFSDDFPRGYLKQVGVTTDHIHKVDSLANEWRTPLSELAPRTLWFPFAGGRARYWILGFAAIALLDALLRRRPTVPFILLMFAPTALVTWLFLDPSCISRYAVAYVPAYALLAAAGMSAVAARLGRFGTAFVGLSGVLVSAMLFAWTRPALSLVHDNASPPVAAFEWVRTHVPRTGPRVFIENELAMHAQYLMRDYDYKLVFEPHDIRAEDMQPGNIFVVEGESRERDARVIRRDRDRLWLLARRRYFETSIIPMHEMVWFREGWYLPEGDVENGWRWMGPRAGLYVPTLAGDGELRMKFYVPIDTTPRPPVLTVTWNGAVVARELASKPEIDLRYLLPSRAGKPNELEITVDVWANPKRDGTGEDSRDLGLKLLSISWESASLH